MYRAHPQPYTLCCHLPGGRRRRPKRRGAPPQAADSRCAKLNAIFGSAVLPLTSKSGTNRDLRAEPPTKTTEGRADSAPPGAPQAPQAVRSAAAGGGQQVREIKRHFRFRGFGTVYQLCGTNRLALGLSPALRLSLHSESVRRREGSRSGLRTPLCADKRYGAEFEAIFLLEKAVESAKFSSLRAQPWWARSGRLRRQIFEMSASRPT